MSGGPIAEATALVGSLGLGAAIAWLLLRGCGLRSSDVRLLSLASAPGVAAGLVSIAYCAKAGLGWPPAGLRTLVAVGAAALLGAAVLRRREVRREPVSSEPAPRLPRTRLGALRAVLVLLAVGLASALLVESLLGSGFGGWDAHAWWNHLARVLTRGYGDLPAGFVNTNYPLLVPGWTAGLWTAAGSDSALVPQLCAASWTSGIALFLSAGLPGTSRASNLTACAVFLTSAPVIHQTTEQYADLPVAYFLVAATVFLTRVDGARAMRGVALLAGANLGLLAWTKNEGGLWALLLAGCWLVARGRSALPRTAVVPLILGAAPGWIALVVYKATWASQWGSQSVGQMLEGDWISRLVKPARWIQPMEALGRILIPDLTPGGWGLTVPFVLVVLALRRRPPALTGVRSERTVLLFLGAFVACLLGIYVLTPKPQDWHLSSSFGRLFLQAIPIALLAAGSALDPWLRSTGKRRQTDCAPRAEADGG